MVSSDFGQTLDVGRFNPRYPLAKKSTMFFVDIIISYELLWLITRK